MNKTVTITLIILLSVVTIFITGIFILLLNSNFKFNIFEFNITNYSTKLIDSKTIEEIKDININSDVADVYIKEGENINIKVELYSNDSEEYSIKEEDNNIDIRLFAKKKSFKFNNKINRIIVYIPSIYENKIKINNRVGDTNIESFSNLNLKVKSTTGDIKANCINKLNYELTTGDVNIDTVKTIKGTATTGDIKINYVNIINVSTTTGDINIDKANIEENSNIKTTTGDIEINNLEGAYIETSTKTGDIDVNNNDRFLEKTIKLTTTTGDIEVNN